jgi:hypothetical protein
MNICFLTLLYLFVTLVTQLLILFQSILHLKMKIANLSIGAIANLLNTAKTILS